MRTRPSRRARVAELAGRTLRILGLAAPGLAGPLLICWGLYLVWPPLALLAGGGFCLLLDRRMP